MVLVNRLELPRAAVVRAEVLRERTWSAHRSAAGGVPGGVRGGEAPRRSTGSGSATTAAPAACERLVGRHVRTMAQILERCVAVVRVRVHGEIVQAAARRVVAVVRIVAT